MVLSSLKGDDDGDDGDADVFISVGFASSLLSSSSSANKVFILSCISFTYFSGSSSSSSVLLSVSLVVSSLGRGTPVKNVLLVGDSGSSVVLAVVVVSFDLGTTADIEVRSEVNSLSY